MAPSRPPPSRPPPTPSGLRMQRPIVRTVGLMLLVGSAWPFWEALRQLDRREFVAAAIAVLVGWLVTQAGIELVRPESAE